MKFSKVPSLLGALPPNPRQGRNALESLGIIEIINLFFFIFCALPCNASQMSFRHMMILSEDIDSISGYYYFAIINNDDKPQPFSSSILLPESVYDFKAESGLLDQDIILGTKGEVSFSKEFKPGFNLIIVGFKATLKDGLLKLTPKFDIDELSIASNKQSQLSFKADHMKPGVPSMLESQALQGIISEKKIKAGDQVIIHVSGMPEKRDVYYLLVFLFLIFLTSFSAFYLKKVQKMRSYASTLN